MAGPGPVPLVGGSPALGASAPQGGRGLERDCLSGHQDPRNSDLDILARAYLSTVERHAAMVDVHAAMFTALSTAASLGYQHSHCRDSFSVPWGPRAPLDPAGIQDVDAGALPAMCSPGRLDGVPSGEQVKPPPSAPPHPPPHPTPTSSLHLNHIDLWC